jgi:hypothetical protein
MAAAASDPILGGAHFEAAASAEKISEVENNVTTAGEGVIVAEVDERFYEQKANFGFCLVISAAGWSNVRREYLPSRNEQKFKI